MSGIWTPIENIDMHCFACGKENDHGLKMVFERNEDRIRAKVNVPGHLRGWSNLVHGGIISTMLDETMGWAAIHIFNRFILTKSMNVNFKKPIKVGSELIVYGYIIDRKDERHATVGAEIIDKDGDVCATSEGEFVLFTPEQFTKLNIIDQEQIDAMTAAAPEYV